MPSQLVFWRALKARHFLLASVSAMTLLANVLAVVFGSLFQVQSVVTRQPFQFRPLFKPQFSDNYTNLEDHPDEKELYIIRENLTTGTPLPPWTSEDFYFLPVFFNNAEASSFEVLTTGFGITSECQVLQSVGPETRSEFSLSPNGTVVNFSSSYTINDGGGDITCAWLEHSELISDDDPNAGYNFSIQGTTQLNVGDPMSLGRQALAYSSLLGSYQDLSTRSINYCRGTILYLWVHATFGEVSGQNFNRSDTMTYQQTDSDLLFVSCRPTLRAADLLVRTDANGQVMTYRQSSPFAPDSSRYVEASTNLTTLYTKLAPVLSIWDDLDVRWSNYSYASDWTNSFLKLLTGSDALLDPSVPLTNYTFIPALESLHRRLFTIALSLRPQIFVSSSPDAMVTGNVLDVKPRVFMNTVSFVISMIILALNLMVAIVYYLDRPAKFLPHMPTSIASIFAYVAASHAREELRRGKSADAYRFGKFIGVDGKMHTRIEDAARVFPLALSYRDDRVMG